MESLFVSVTLVLADADIAETVDEFLRSLSCLCFVRVYVSGRALVKRSVCVVFVYISFLNDQLFCFWFVNISVCTIIHVRFNFLLICLVFTKCFFYLPSGTNCTRHKLYLIQS